MGLTPEQEIVRDRIDELLAELGPVLIDEAAIQRLEAYQDSEFRCRENALAITHAQEALHWLQHRTAAREARGVEGTHQP